jgi:hypothetical protein
MLNQNVLIENLVVFMMAKSIEQFASFCIEKLDLTGVISYFLVQRRILKQNNAMLISEKIDEDKSRDTVPLTSSVFVG